MSFNATHLWLNLKPLKRISRSSCKNKAVTQASFTRKNIIYADLKFSHLIFYAFFTLFTLKMAVSKQLIHVIGLHVTVYGLDEYNQLPKGTPVSVMFALHGRLRKLKVQ